MIQQYIIAICVCVYCIFTHYHYINNYYYFIWKYCHIYIYGYGYGIRRQLFFYTHTTNRYKRKVSPFSCFRHSTKHTTHIRRAQKQHTRTRHTAFTFLARVCRVCVQVSPVWPGAGVYYAACWNVQHSFKLKRRPRDVAHNIIRNPNLCVFAYTSILLLKCLSWTTRPTQSSLLACSSVAHWVLTAAWPVAVLGQSLPARLP